MFQGSTTSVTLFWVVFDTAFIANFTVHYRIVSGGDETSVTVPGTERSATITGLANGAQYHFQVATTISFMGVVTAGERSAVTEQIITANTISQHQSTAAITQTSAEGNYKQ